MSCFFQVSLGLINAKASHIVWPPSRWQRLDRFLPSQRVKHPAANFSTLELDNDISQDT